MDRFVSVIGKLFVVGSCMLFIVYSAVNLLIPAIDGQAMLALTIYNRILIIVGFILSSLVALVIAIWAAMED